MIVEEAAAKFLWCPFGRRLYADEDGSGAGINRRHDHRSAEISPCLGSGCMAWRWAESTGPDDETDGFCGLAGRVDQ